MWKVKGETQTQNYSVSRATPAPSVALANRKQILKKIVLKALVCMQRLISKSFWNPNFAKDFFLLGLKIHNERQKNTYYIAKVSTDQISLHS